MYTPIFVVGGGLRSMRCYILVAALDVLFVRIHTNSCELLSVYVYGECSDGSVLNVDN